MFDVNYDDEPNLTVGRTDAGVGQFSKFKSATSDRISGSICRPAHDYKC